ncbi:MAG TPA: DUF3037 domain-containing protein [Candidatus Acidoferrales bacterium]
MPGELTDYRTANEAAKRTFQYRILRYVPNLVRDEWMNIGVLLEAADESLTAIRMITEAAELARVRRLHGDVDEDLLHNLRLEFEARLRGSPSEISAYLAKLDQTLSNALQFSPRKGLLAEDFYSELDRLYRDQVAPPSGRRRGQLVQSARDWMRDKLKDVFSRHRVLGKLEQNVSVEGFTYKGDPMKIDYGYQNGERGFIQTVSLKRDVQQAKVLAYTAQRIHGKDPRARISAITEIEPDPRITNHQFVQEILAEQKVRIVPLNQVEKFAEELRLSLH